jgi:hypothetical protein
MVKDEEVFIFAKWKQKNVTCLQQRNDEEFFFTFSKIAPMKYFGMSNLSSRS